MLGAGGLLSGFSARESGWLLLSQVSPPGSSSGHEHAGALSLSCRIWLISIPGAAAPGSISSRVPIPPDRGAGVVALFTEAMAR